MHVWFLAASFVVVPACLLINRWIDRRDAARKPLPFASVRNQNIVDLADHRAYREDPTKNRNTAVFASQRAG